MKILVTGGLGFIGSHTVVSLIEAGHTPVIIDDLSNSQISVLEGIKKITNTRPTFHQGSACDASFITEVCATEKFDGIIHFAAYKAVGESIEKPLDYYENNLSGLITLLRAVVEHNIATFIFSSSATVYGDSSENPISESAPRKQATNPYRNTKLISEDILRDIVKSGTALKAISLRYFNPIGAHSSAAIGELPNGVPANLVPYLMQTAAGKRKYLQVFGNDYNTPDGTGVRDFIHVVDLADAHVKALEYTMGQKEESSYDVFNIGTGAGTSVKELIDTFEKITGKPLPYKIAPRRDGDIAACWADPTKMNTHMGWYSQKTLEDALRDAWRWEQNL